MRTYRATYKDRKGRTQESQKWYCEFKDHLEIVRRWPLSADKSAASEIGRKIERLVALKMAGEQPDAGLTAWLETITSELRDRLMGAGLLSAVRVAAGQQLEHHLEDYKADLVAAGCSEKHVQVAHSRAKTVIFRRSVTGTV